MPDRKTQPPLLDQRSGGGLIIRPIARLPAHRLDRAAPCARIATPSSPRSVGRRAALEEVDARVVALSVDDEATTAALIEKRRLGFPIGHSADAAAVSAAVGAYTNSDPVYLEVNRIRARS
ncbi:hypothetical protein I545_6692 [Mycobacterium kansasii 662]|uniref:Uncharacterized protein n=1 Tax=Mycobacterium kansasii 662 TaxID=1299326 RepID=X7Y0S0_MYCKA|nr:hypothetical protein [Mycobacterium kansasii]EUA00113.1 hypothetical protein I545_6692 [Mycobacterium kansasii 662]